MRAFKTYQQTPSLADWLHFFRTRRRLFGMWWARHFPKRARRKSQPKGRNPLAAIGWPSSAQHAHRAQHAVAVAQQEAYARQYGMAQSNAYAGLLQNENYQQGLQNAYGSYANQLSNFQQSLAQNGMAGSFGGASETSTGVRCGEYRVIRYAPE